MHFSIKAVVIASSKQNNQTEKMYDHHGSCPSRVKTLQEGVITVNTEVKRLRRMQQQTAERARQTGC